MGKKIQGKMVYFGVWADPDAALAKYLAERPCLLLGVEAPGVVHMSLDDMVNAYLGYTDDRVRSGEMAKRTWADYKHTAELLLKHFGRSRDIKTLQPSDFAGYRASLAKTRGLVALGNEICRVKVIFNFAVKNRMLDISPFGASFEKPSKVAVKREALAKPKKLFTIDELRVNRCFRSDQLPRQASPLCYRGSW